MSREAEAARKAASINQYAYKSGAHSEMAWIITSLWLAGKAFDGIKEKWLLIHPQVVVERDKLLRSLGPETIPERETWLSKLDALTDEWVIERRIQLLIDKKAYQQAKDLLLSTPFQNVHQTYTRTGLWMQLCGPLQLPCSPIPSSLGEDRLARFGAYREYE